MQNQASLIFKIALNRILTLAFDRARREVIIDLQNNRVRRCACAMQEGLGPIIQGNDSQTQRSHRYINLSLGMTKVTRQSKRNFILPRSLDS